MDGVRVLWRRTVHPGLHIWVRADEILVLGDELVDVATGAAVAEDPSAFLGRLPWSQQQWEPDIEPVATRVEAKRVERRYARVHRGLLVVGTSTGRGEYPPRYEFIVQATRGGGGPVAWQHTISGIEELGMWMHWLQARDGCMIGRPDPNRSGRRTFCHPDLGTGDCAWYLRWDTKTWPPPQAGTAPSGECVILFDSSQPVVGAFDAGTGAPSWRIDLAEGTIPVAVRAWGDYVVVCSFPRDTTRQPTITHSHSVPPPIRLAGACTCEHPAAGREANICDTCSGFFRPWMTVGVHDRATGSALWNRRWPYGDRLGILAVVDALSLADSSAGPVVVTQEQHVLRAWRMADGAALWELSPQSMTDPAWRSVRKSGMPRAFAGTTKSRRMPWIWLQESTGSVREGTRAYLNVFIDPLTARQVSLADVFHLREDGLAIAKTRGTITCYALPLS